MREPAYKPAPSPRAVLPLEEQPKEKHTSMSRADLTECTPGKPTELRSYFQNRILLRVVEEIFPVMQGIH